MIGWQFSPQSLGTNTLQAGVGKLLKIWGPTNPKPQFYNNNGQNEPSHKLFCLSIITRHLLYLLNLRIRPLCATARGVAQPTVTEQAQNSSKPSKAGAMSECGSKQSNTTCKGGTGGMRTGIPAAWHGPCDHRLGGLNDFLWAAVHCLPGSRGFLAPGRQFVGQLHMPPVHGAVLSARSFTLPPQESKHGCSTRVEHKLVTTACPYFTPVALTAGACLLFGLPSGQLPSPTVQPYCPDPPPPHAVPAVLAANGCSCARTPLPTDKSPHYE
eukprot:56743-Chlamydomonas_euryale.AAC.2